MMNPDYDDAFGSHGEEENYFVSMTDMMVGMVFIFILMLMYYALQVRIVVDGATSTRDTRIQIIKDIVKEVREGGVEVEEDAVNGIIRLKNNVLFGSGQSEVSDDGLAALDILATAILTHTQCHTFVPESVVMPNVSCEGRRHTIDAIFVEGHTDSDPIKTDRLSDNWDLSVARATNTYRVLASAEPRLTTLRNAPSSESSSEGVLSVAGYGFERPIADEQTQEGKALNRRIDIRILMRPPEAPNLTASQTVNEITESVSDSLPDND